MKTTNKKRGATRLSGSRNRSPRIKKLTMHRILVPVDFSGDSRKALDYALALAEQNRARISLLHVVQLPTLAIQPVVGGGLGSAAFERETLVEHAKRELDRLCAEAIPAKLVDGTAVREGVPYDEIIRAASTQRADLIILGTHGTSGLKRMVAGSTAERVVRFAPCPVLIVRDPA